MYSLTDEQLDIITDHIKQRVFERVEIILTDSDVQRGLWADILGDKISSSDLLCIIDEQSNLVTQCIIKKFEDRVLPRVLTTVYFYLADCSFGDYIDERRLAHQLVPVFEDFIFDSSGVFLNLASDLIYEINIKKTYSSEDIPSLDVRWNIDYTKVFEFLLDIESVVQETCNTDTSIINCNKGGNIMRTKMRNLHGKRVRFIATVGRTGTKKSGFTIDPLVTQLLLSLKLKECGTLLTDHIWMNCGKSFRGVSLGDEVEFTARITEYIKGHFKEDIQSIDYRLSYPSKVLITKKATIKKENL